VFYILFVFAKKIIFKILSNELIMNILVKGYIIVFSLVFLQKIDASAFSFSPTQGNAGDTVTITLSTPLPADTSGLFVYFSPFIKAQIIQANDITVKTIVPIGTVSGSIRIAFNGRINTSSEAFYIRFNSNETFQASWHLEASTIINNNSSTPSSPLPGGESVYNSVADIDGDGKADFIAVVTGFNGISIVRNRMPFEFDPFRIFNSISFDEFSTNLPSGDTSLFNVDVVDINADGKPDLVGVSLHTNNIYLYINESTPGNIQFKPVLKIAVKATTLSKILSKDINNDGLSDLIVSSSDSSIVSIHINKAINNDINAASFNDTVLFFNQTCRPNGVYGIAVEDMNDDNLPDLLVSGYCSNTLHMFFNQGISASGFPNLSSPQIIPVSSQPINIATADLNNDKKIDIILTHDRDTVITVIQNNGFVSGQMQVEKSKIVNRFSNGRVARNYWNMATVDVDGDGKLDLITSFLTPFSAIIVNKNESNENIVLFVEDDMAENVVSGVHLPRGISAADFDHDGRPDMAINGLGGSVLLSGRFSIVANRFGFPTSLRKTESINQLAAGNRLRFYPNPAKTIIQFDELPAQTEISIYTVYGRLALTTQVQGDKTIDVQHLPIGTYLIKVNTSGQYGVLIKE